MTRVLMAYHLITIQSMKFLRQKTPICPAAKSLKASMHNPTSRTYPSAYFFLVKPKLGMVTFEANRLVWLGVCLLTYSWQSDMIITCIYEIYKQIQKDKYNI